jgi:S1-C subfamily serine protease
MAAMITLLGSGLSWAQPRGDRDGLPGYLGVLVSAAERGMDGALVQEVTPDSPAAKAGLRRGDRIVKMDDKGLTSVEAFLRNVAARKPQEKMKLGIMRDGKEQMLTVTLGERPPAERPGPAFRRPAFLGVQLQPLSAELKTRLRVETETGVVVTEVMPNSPAAKAGLKADDVITSINDHPVKSVADLREAVQRAGAGKEITIHGFRGKEKLNLKASLRESTSSFFLPPGEEGIMFDMESMMDQSHRIRELEQKIETLEKRLR